MTGQKLLLADDSVTIQKVIDLTFSDEGMEVTTVGDGEQAIRKLEEYTPDIVLADVLMPGVDGYRLCEFIKQSDRFRRIPVILLVGSFEPFDEAEARRVGADDVVTKPFQSIRQLVSRVGSLLGGKPHENQVSAGFSTLGLGQTSPAPAAAAEASIEAATLAADGRDMEMQTADTRELRPVEAISAVPVASLPKNFEAQPVNMLTAAETFIANDDVLLDLDDFDTLAPAPDVEDSILDLEYIDVVDLTVPAAAEESPAMETAGAGSEISGAAEGYEPARETVPPAAQPEWTAAEGKGAEAKTDVELPAMRMGATELSSAAVDAIAQRVIERLSDKVVREIAWEVVPELAELLIKQRMDEQKK